MKHSKWILLFIAGAVAALLPYATLLSDADAALLYRDISNVWLPYKVTWLEGVRELGRLPHWDPLHSGGMRFIADMNYGPLYPLNWLYLPLSALGMARAFSFVVAFHHLLIYLGFSLLFRDLRVRPWLAVLGGLAVSWSGVSISSDNLFHRLGAIVSIGFFFLFWRSALRTRRIHFFFLSSLALAWPIYSGAAQNAYLLVISALALLLGTKFPWKKKLEAAALLGMLSFLAAAPQLLSSLSYLQTFERILDFSDMTETMAWSLHPLRTFGTIFPLPFGDSPSEFKADFLINGAPTPFLFSLYIGVIAGVFSLLHLLLRPIPRRWQGKELRRFLLFLSWIFLLLLAWGSFSPVPAYALLTKVLPFWEGFRFPERLGLWVCLGLLIHGFVSAEKSLRLTSRNIRLPIRWTWLGFALPSAGMGVWLAKNSLAWQSPLRTLAFASLLLLCLDQRRLRSWLPAAFSLIFLLDQLPIAQKLVWIQPASLTKVDLYPWAKKILEDKKQSLPPGSDGDGKRFFSPISSKVPPPTDIQENTLAASVYSVWAGMKFNAPSAWGLPLVRGHTALTPMRPVLSLVNKSDELTQKVLDLFSTRYLLYLKNGVPQAVKNLSALPYVFLPPQSISLKEENNVLREMERPDWNPRQTAFLESDAMIEETNLPSPPTLLEWQRNWDQISIRLRAKKESPTRWLVVSEAFDPLWRVWLDDQELKVVRANGWSMAVRLPELSAGREAQLRFQFVDVWYERGLALFVLWLIFFLFTPFLPFRKSF